MKKLFACVCFLFTILSLSAYGNKSYEKGGDEKMTEINIQIGDNYFKGKIFDTPTGESFLNQLPLSIEMSDLNNNEKYSYLPNKLPVNSQYVERIKTGDLMLFGSECLVLFYEDFNTSYRYTKIGHVENPENLKKVLGRKDVEISFSR